MEKLDGQLLEDLVLTGAMEDYAAKEDEFDSLNDVVDRLFENFVIDRDKYLHSVMSLTKMGYVKSDLTEEEDIEMSEAVGYDIQGLTEKGKEYLKNDLGRAENKETLAAMWNKFNEVCNKVADNSIVKLLANVVIPMISLFK